MALKNRPIMDDKSLPNRPTSANFATQTLFFTFETSTTGAHRFKECDDTGRLLNQSEYVVGTLYLRKSQIGENPPKNLYVTISELPI